MKIRKELDVNPEDLEEKGWTNSNKKVGFFEIWEKEEIALLYDTKEKQVFIIFEK